MVLDPEEIRLTPRQFESLAKIIEECSGLHFDETSQGLFQRRLAARIEANGFDSFARYAQLLERGHLLREPAGLAELDRALAELTVGETYFFRHDEQMHLLEHEIFPQLAQQNQSHRNLSVWSAGCSSGEELYSLAMLALESGSFEGWNLTFVGGDLSKDRVEQARAGLYSRGAFRTTSDRRREMFFEQEERGLRVKQHVRDICQFHVTNLLSPDSYAWIGRVHLALCRNVLIYLSDRARRQVMEGLHGRLTPGGYLLLGHSESLAGWDLPIQFDALGHDMAYQRPLLSRPGAKP